MWLARRLGRGVCGCCVSGLRSGIWGEEGGAQVAGIGMHYMCGIISTISIFNRSRIVIFQKLSMRILKFL